MDLTGSLVDTNLRIYPTDKLIKFIKTIPASDAIPHNILQIIKPNSKCTFKTYKLEDLKPVYLNSSEIEYVEKVRGRFYKQESVKEEENIIDTDFKKKLEEKDLEADTEEKLATTEESIETKLNKTFETETDAKNKTQSPSKESLNSDDDPQDDGPFLVTSDIDWVYAHLKTRKSNGDKNIPYLHALLEGVSIKLPENETIKRNPVLEARCVKLRAQQEAREYRKMTKSVDNVRMRFPEDSISYQMKQLNRHLIAIGQFIISIFAGFLFGFRGVEWMVGNLDFGFRLLLGVMCALVIALAEIYFLAKKLNEELCVPETMQIGGPVKFADQDSCNYKNSEQVTKLHQD